MNMQIPNRLRFPYCGFLWDGAWYIPKSGRRIVIINGPLCKECKTKLSILSFESKAVCIVCKKEFPYDTTHLGKPSIEEEAKAYLEAKYDEDVPIVSFDLTPTKIIKEDNQDENYWLQAKIIQKDGKKMAIVYMGEKIHGKQNKNDYTQLFVDVDDEQIRFDKGNKNPMKLLFKIEAEFQNSTGVIKKKSEK